MEIRVYHCFDFVNENSELFVVDRKETIQDETGKTIKLIRKKGSETTLKALYADGFRVDEIIKLDNANSKLVAVIIVSRTL